MKYMLDECLRRYLAEGAHQPIRMRTVPSAELFFVHNVEGTKDEPIPDGCESFLDFWEKKAGKPAPRKCCARDPHVNVGQIKSDVTEVVGAHVRIDDEKCPDDWAWIVPLCKHCNNDNRTWTILLEAGTVLVPIKLSKERKTASHFMDEWVKGCWALADK